MARKNYKQTQHKEMVRVLLGIIIVSVALGVGIKTVNRNEETAKVLGEYTINYEAKGLKEKQCKANFEKYCKKNKSINYCVKLEENCEGYLD